jgi:hypothetical protein
MAVIEETVDGRYGLWVDGFEPSHYVLTYPARGKALRDAHIEDHVQSRYGLEHHAANASMAKGDLWPRLLGAYVEQELRNRQETPDRVGLHLLKRESASEIESPSLLFLGAMSGHIGDRDIGVVRQNYCAIVATSPENKAQDVRGSAESALESLGFRVSSTLRYEDYAGFEGECRRFLKRMLSARGDIERCVALCEAEGFDMRRVL